MDKISIKEFKTKNEGVILTLTEKTKLKTGNITSNQFFVSWDKIGELLFENYYRSDSVVDYREARQEIK